MTQPFSWHNKNISEIFEILHSTDHGLTIQEAENRLKEKGPNKLPTGKVDSLLTIFLRQFQSPLIYILFVASFIIFFSGEIIDGSIILLVLLFNAIVGTIQEGKAQNTLLALKKFVETNAIVLRGGKEIIIPDSELVPGDIIFLQEGEKVPADARIIHSANLKIDEASLTGESGPILKSAEIIPVDDHSFSEHRNIIFKGTHILAGNGKAIVFATGMETEIGKISKEISTIDSEIPLKANIRYLSRLIILVVACTSVTLFLLGIFTGKSSKEMFSTIVSLCVSIIPEGLPIVMTLVLASGVWRMSKRNVLVKRLQAVETLGQASIIAVDKTGTITKNEMVVQNVYVNNKNFVINGVGYEPIGDVLLNGEVIDAVNHQDLLLTGRIASFCANARVSFLEENKVWRVTGDPTEAAMLVFSEKIGFHKDEMERESPLIGEISFDSKLKFHTMLHLHEGKKFLTVVGAPEQVLNLSDKIWNENGIQLFSKEKKEEMESIFFKMSGEGLRIIAMAYSDDVAGVPLSNEISSLTFVGFFGMKDALRLEAKEAVQKSTSAGIRVVMITGDHKITAVAVAKEVGIFKEGDTVLIGQEIDELSDAELSDKVANVSVFVRVTPEHKLRIIRAFKSRGEIIAMTGDGVNDAPSLVAADLGVAMGKIGTEVAKESSDLILLDDNFGSIVSAVEEGRNIYKTIKKVILYLFSTNCGEALTIAGSLILSYPLPLLPAQIIWLNFVTDGFLDVALAMEPKEEGLLRGNYEHPTKYIIDALMAKRILLMSVVMMVGTLFLFRGYFQNDIVKAWTVSLTTLAVFQWFNAWNCRHESKSIFQMNLFSNKYLVAATCIIISLQLLVIYNPLMQSLFHTTALGVSDWFVIIPIASSIVLVEEIRKFFHRRRITSV